MSEPINRLNNKLPQEKEKDAVNYNIPCIKWPVTEPCKSIVQASIDKPEKSTFETVRKYYTNSFMANLRTSEDIKLAAYILSCVCADAISYAAQLKKELDELKKEQQNSKQQKKEL